MTNPPYGEHLIMGLQGFHLQAHQIEELNQVNITLKIENKDYNKKGRVRSNATILRTPGAKKKREKKISHPIN